MTADNHPFSRQTLILPVYLPTFLLSFGQGVVNPTLSLYVKSFDLSYAMTMFVIATAVFGNVPAGVLLAKIGQKRAMIIGTIILALSRIGVGLAVNVIQLVTFQLIGGIGVALWSLSRHAYMTQMIPITERGRSLAIFGGINRIASFSGQLVVIFLGQNLRLPFFIYAGAAIFTSGLCVFFVHDHRLTTADLPNTERPQTSALKKLLNLLQENYKILATAGLAQVCIQTIRRGRTLMVPLFASSVVGLSSKQVRQVVAISSAVDMLIFPLAGSLMDTYGRKSAMIPGFTIFATGILMMAQTNNFLPLLFATVVMGVGNGLCSGTMMTLGADLAPRDNISSFLSLWRITGDIGGNAGPFIVGSIADIWELKTSVMVLSGIGYLAVVIFWGLVPETLPDRGANNRSQIEKSR